MAKKIPAYSPEMMVNHPDLPKALIGPLKVGQDALIEKLGSDALRRAKDSPKRICRLALDGHVGVDWDILMSDLASWLRLHDARPLFFPIADCLNSNSVIDRILRKSLPDDPIFGRVTDAALEDFFSKAKIARLAKELRAAGGTAVSQPVVAVCFGSGSTHPALRRLYDAVAWFDLTREEILKRLKAGSVTLLGGSQNAPKPAPKAKSDKDQPAALPAYFSTRRLYYVEYQILDAHRNRVAARADYYIDANQADRPNLLPRDLFSALFTCLAESPLLSKPTYDPGPWGGKWLKRVRRLPKDMVNCAWSYDLIAPEASFLVELNGVRVEFPFMLLPGIKPREVMGRKGTGKRFAGQFPIRINYDDSYEGGDMALQSHPNDEYIRKTFNEPFRQDESYYIVDAEPHGKVHLGLTRDADVEEFRRVVKRAEKDHIPFDHGKYIHSVPCKTGDLVLLPAGTAHGSGAGLSVLEISANTYRYTFHFYDFLRPGLDGKLRAIHADHAFAALCPERREGWVEKHLKQSPRLLAKGRGWAEYLLGRMGILFFEVRRLEFEKKIEQDTAGEFHLLVCVSGEGVQIRPKAKGRKACFLPYSCLCLVPAETGAYGIASADGKPSQVVKVILK